MTVEAPTEVPGTSSPDRGSRKGLRGVPGAARPRNFPAIVEQKAQVDDINEVEIDEAPTIIEPITHVTHARRPLVGGWKKTAVELAVAAGGVATLLTGVNMAASAGAGTETPFPTTAIETPAGVTSRGPELRTTEQILQEIKTKYGVTIPDHVDPLYSRENTDGSVTPNLVPNPEQASAIEEAIARIPRADYLAPIMLLYKGTDISVTTGDYLGYLWPLFLHRSQYPSFQYDRLLGGEAAVEVDIPDVNLNTALPKKTAEMGLLPRAPDNPNTTETVPWTTQKERLEQVITHEYGHAIQDQASLRASILREPTDPAAAIKDYWSKQSYAPYNQNTWDTTNPVYEGFAKVDGWKLIPYPDFVRQFDPEAADQIPTKYPQDANLLIWDRDPAVWGDLEHRINQLTIYASYGPIQEAWAEFWMTYIRYPQLLTQQQRAFFQNIQQGLRNGPDDFFRRVVQNPNSLL
jgi:hypothetical protein